MKPKPSGFGAALCARVLHPAGVEITGEGSYPAGALILITPANAQAIFNAAVGVAIDGKRQSLVEPMTGDPLTCASPSTFTSETVRFIGSADPVAETPKSGRPPEISEAKWTKLNAGSKPQRFRGEDYTKKLVDLMASRATALRADAEAFAARATEAERHATLAKTAEADPAAQRALRLRPRLHRAGLLVKNNAHIKDACEPSFLAAVEAFESQAFELAEDALSLFDATMAKAQADHVAACNRRAEANSEIQVLGMGHATQLGVSSGGIQVRA